jgi:hypothetical protein
VTALEMNSSGESEFQIATPKVCRVFRIWLAGILIAVICPNAFAQSDFSVFWKKFSSAVGSDDKAGNLAALITSMSNAVKV